MYKIMKKNNAHNLFLKAVNDFADLKFMGSLFHALVTLWLNVLVTQLNTVHIEVYTIAKYVQQCQLQSTWFSFYINEAMQ